MHVAQCVITDARRVMRDTWYEMRDARCMCDAQCMIFSARYVMLGYVRLGLVGLDCVGGSRFEVVGCRFEVVSSRIEVRV
jgi:hypothetical protein